MQQKEKFENKKGVIRRRKSKNDKQIQWTKEKRQKDKKNLKIPKG
jgi:hypothetical protein